jgi:signal transduction histidine kinase/ligand-binding sensor domain-containing protein
VKRLLITLLLFVSLPNCAFSQQLPVRLYTVRDGSPTVQSIPRFVDSYGFLWLTDNDGYLVAFDGGGFISYASNDGIPGRVYCAVPTPEENIWVGGEFGLLLARRSSTFPLNLQFEPVKRHGRTLGAVLSMAADAEGSLFFVMNDWSLWKISQGALSAVQFVAAAGPINGAGASAQSDLLVNLTYAEVTFDRTGHLWISNHYELICCTLLPHDSDSVTIARIERRVKKAKREQQVFAFDHANRLIHVSGDSTLIDTPPSRRLRFSSEPVDRYFATSVAVDNQNHTWIGTANRIVQVSPEFWRTGNSSAHVQTFGPSNGLPPSRGAAGMFIDRFNNLWAGWQLTRVLRWNLSGFVWHRTPGLPLDAASKAIPWSRGKVWFRGTGCGLAIFDPVSSPARLKRIFHADIENKPTADLLDLSFADGDTLLLAGDDGFAAWAIAQPDGPSTFHRFAIAEGGDNQNFLSDRGYAFLQMRRDRTGNIWISKNLVGVARCVAERGALRVLEVYDERRGLPDVGVRVIRQTSDGSVWFGGYSEGLSRLKDGVMRNFTTEGSFPRAGVRAVYEASDGRIWIGTRYSGLFVFDGETFRQYPSIDVLRSNAVWALSSSRNGIIFAGTGNGLKAFRPDSLLSVQPYVRHFGPSDGIPEEAVYSVFFDQDSTLFCTLSKGIYSVEGRHVQDVETRSVPYLKSLKVNGVETQASPTLTLNYDQNTITVEYGLVDISGGPQELCEFSFSSGEDVWTAPTLSRSLTFAGLDAASYEFKLRVAGSAATSAQEPVRALLQFTITPPFWERWWFRLSAFLLVVALGSIAYNIRVNQLFKVERLRGRIATDLHDDIGTSLTRIALFSDVALRDTQKNASSSEKTLRMLEEIGTTARNLIDAMNDIVWSIDPLHDSFDQIALRMKDYTTKLMTAHGITHSVVFGPELNDLKLSIDVRRHLFLILKEALNNIVKHAHATTVTISMSSNNHTLELVIEDDGKGLESGMMTSGHGLKNMKERAAAVNGVVTIESASAGGTRLFLRMKLP